MGGHRKVVFMRTVKNERVHNQVPLATVGGRGPVLLWYSYETRRGLNATAFAKRASLDPSMKGEQDSTLQHRALSVHGRASS